MAELDCSAVNCTYNKTQLCCKGDIMVGGKHAEEDKDTCCDSFAERRGDSYTSAIEHPCRTISIDCEATKCIYNTNYKCYAEHVDISGGSTSDREETCCSTFKER